MALYGKTKLVIAVLATLMLSAAALADEWHFSARVNAWLPDVSGKTAFPDQLEQQDFQIDIEDVLDKIELGFLGSFEARKGRWGVVTDLVYASIGDSSKGLREGSIGLQRAVDVETRIAVDLDVENWIWNTAGFYRLLQSETLTVDALGGVRYLDVEQDLDWTISTSIAGQPLPERSGSVEVSEDSWDAFLGIRGRLSLSAGSAFFVPFYLDGGTGDADFTWQAATGLGYARGRWNFGLIWRHLEYDLGSGAVIGELALSGPAGVFEYNW